MEEGLCLDSMAYSGQNQTWYAPLDITSAANAPPAARLMKPTECKPGGFASPIACCAGTNNTPRIYFTDQDGRIQGLRYSSGWKAADLTTKTGTPRPAAFGNPLACRVMEGLYSCVYFEDSDGHIHELRENADATWTPCDLTALTKAPIPAQECGPLMSCVTGDGDTRVYYIAAAGTGAGAHIHELLRDKSAAWRHQDITQSQQDLPDQYPNPSTLACCVLSNENPSIYYRGENDIHELAET